jgi:DNA-binding transcriptional LysR family regulator
MELRHLRYFVAVAEERSFSRAAIRLNLSQPPLSRQIQDLEADLGVILFDRSSKQIELTSAGRAFLPKARNVLFESRIAVEEARRWANGYNETINIGFMSAIMLLAFNRFLEPFHQNFPAVAFRFTQMRSDEQFSAVIDDRIDVGFVDFGIDQIGDRFSSNKIVSQFFLREELCVALPRDHYLSGKREIELAELRDESFAILERHLFPAHHDMVISECQKAGFAPKIAHRADQIPTVLTYVAARMGVGIVPRIAEVSWGHLVSMVSLIGRPHIDIHMISRDDCSLQSVEHLKHAVSKISGRLPKESSATIATKDCGEG